MTYQRFRSLMLDALDCKDYDQYIAECGGSVDDPLCALPYVWNYAHAKECKTIRAVTGLSQADFAREYNIPQRTYESWESSASAASGRRTTAAMIDLLAFAVLCDLMGED